MLKWIWKKVYKIWTGEAYIENIHNPSYSHFYYNALKEKVKCVILREEESTYRIMNENKIRVILLKEDVKKI